MEYKYLKIERDKQIATVVFNRPEKMNALSIGFMSEIIKVTREFYYDDQGCGFYRGGETFFLWC